MLHISTDDIYSHLSWLEGKTVEELHDEIIGDVRFPKREEHKNPWKFLMAWGSALSMDLYHDKCIYYGVNGLVAEGLVSEVTKPIIEEDGKPGIFVRIEYFRRGARRAREKQRETLPSSTLPFGLEGILP